MDLVRYDETGGTRKTGHGSHGVLIPQWFDGVHPARSIIDQLDSHILILDEYGVITSVNEAWRAFSRDVGLTNAQGGSGIHYVTAVLPALPLPEDGVEHLQEGVRRVLEQQQSTFEGEFSCDIPTGRQWFQMNITSGQTDSGHYYLVTHTDISRQKLAEHAWREADSRYHAVLSNVPGTVYISSSDDPGQVLKQSVRYSLRFGYPAELWHENPNLWRDILHPDDWDLVHTNDRRAVETGEAFSIEYRFITSDGSIAWVRDSASLVLDADGQPLNWIGIAVDITDYKTIEHALMSSQEQFRSAFDDNPVAMAISTFENEYVRINRPYCELFGVSEQELMSQSVVARIHPDDFRSALQERDALIAGEIPKLTAERRLVRPDGTVLYGLLSVSVIHDDTGQQFLLTQIQDITERKSTEDRLREVTDQLTSVIDASPIAIMVTDLEHKIVEWNPMCEQMFGWSAEEVLGKPTPVIPVTIAGNAVNARMRVLAGEVIHSVEVQRLRKDGSLIDVSLSGAPVRDADGNIRGGIAMFIDMTKIKSDEVARTRRARLLGLVSGTIGLDEILNSLCELVESEIPGTRASIMLLDQTSMRLFVRGNGSLPETFVQAISGAVANTGSGSCGAAVFRGEPVIVSDIETDPLWNEYRDVAVAHGLRSCWSMPILADDDSVLGTFGVYSTTSRFPTDQAMEALLGASHLARIAIERKLADERIRESEQQFRGAFEFAATGLVFVGLDGTFLKVNSAFAQMLGYEIDELTGKNFRDITHPDDLPLSESVMAILLQDPGRAMEVEKRYLHRNGSSVWVHLTTSMVVDVDGDDLYRITQVNDITPSRQALEAVRQSEERFRGLIQHAADITTIIDKDLNIVYESPSVGPILGLHPEDIIGMPASQYLHPDEHESLTSFFNDMLERPGEHRPLTLRARHADGTYRWLEAKVSNLMDAPGIEGLVINARDITDRLAAERALRESEERFRSAFEDASVAMAILSLDNTFLRVNAALCELSGYSEHELIGWSGAKLNHPDDDEIAMPYFAQILNAEINSFQIERRYIHRDGSTIWGLVNISVARDESGQLVHFLAQVQDITERKDLENSLHHQAFHDMLTGLPNRALLLQHLGQTLDIEDRDGGETALLFLDLDNFKVVNDSLGHIAGDTLLVQLASRLLGCVDPQDTVARLGGDEFAILLRSLPSSAYAVDIAQRVIRVFEEPFQISGRRISTSPSIGIVISEQGDTAEEILRQADVAMYRAKARGRNRVELFDSEMHADALQRLELEYDLRSAVQDKQFVVYYQPTIDMQKRAICGVEALVRWNHPERGIVFPDSFISLAEETGLILQLGDYVLREACRQGQEWVEAGLLDSDCSISVNLSALQFVQPGLVGQIRGILAETGLSAHQLVLEMTETVLMEDIEESVERLDELSGLGVRIAIDDFGTGYSSLSYLRRFPVDLLKIDRSFVSRLTTSSADTAIVNAIVSLGNSLGIRTVAEGVETPAQLEHLSSIGCSWAQGYLFARPEPAEIIGRVLDRERKPGHH